MPIPALRASRAERKCCSRPSIRRLPWSAACTPAMIFMSVLLPAPFSPTRPWISPRASAKSTPRSASTPPKDLETWTSSRSGVEASNEIDPKPVGASDQVVRFHPHHARSVLLGDHRAIGDDVLGNATRPRLLAIHHCGNAGDDGTAMNTAGGIAHGGVHASVQHRIEGRRHGIDPADQ